MSSSDKIVYAPRAENGHANSRTVRITWPKVIVIESYLAVSSLGLRPRFLTLALDSSRSPSASCDELTLAVHSPVFISRRVMYYYERVRKVMLVERTETKLLH